MSEPTPMPFTFEVLQDFLGTIALTGLLAVAYGTITRAFRWVAAAQAALGVLFGVAAVLAMVDPLHLADGVLVHLRSVPLTLAGAFLGVLGAAVTTLTALVARVWIGSAGLITGLASTVLSTLIGLGWAAFVRRPGQRIRNLLLLAALSQLSLVTYVLLPRDLAWQAVTTVWPVVVPFRFAGVLIVGALLKREMQIGKEAKRLGLAAIQDPLTGLLNRRGFDLGMARLPTSGCGSALLVLDLDHFKRVNDTHGHAAGDAVLQNLATRLLDALRPEDVVARVGGEEVAVFLAEVDARTAMATAARLCRAVRDYPFVLPNRKQATVTVSVGGAWTSGQVSLEALMAQADAALYSAKAAGRDCWRFDAGLRLVDQPAGPEHPAAIPALGFQAGAA